MKKIFKTLTALAIGASLVGVSLVAAAPASAAPPVKPVCYNYTWDVQTKVGTPVYAPYPGDYVAGAGVTYQADATGLYVAAPGGSSFSARLLGTDFPFSEATAGGYLSIIEDSEISGTPVGVVDVDLNGDGSVDTTLKFSESDSWADISAANPDARVKALGVDWPDAQGYIWLVSVAAGPEALPFYVYGGQTFAWTTVSTGSGPEVPASTATVKYVETSKTVVKCSSGKR
jgi:hypothetical protein